MPEQLPNVQALIDGAKREAYGEDEGNGLLLAKKPLPAPPKGNPNVTEIVHRRRAMKFDSDKLYQQLGVTAQAYNTVRAAAMGLQRLVEQMHDRAASKKASEKDKTELKEYESALKLAGFLLASLKDLGRKKVAETKEMEEAMTRVRTDLFKEQRKAAKVAKKNTEEEAENEADAQKPKYEELVQPYPMHRTPSVLISPKKLLLRAKKEAAAKEKSTSVEKAAEAPDKQSPETT